MASQDTTDNLTEFEDFTIDIQDPISTGLKVESRPREKTAAWIGISLIGSFAGSIFLILSIFALILLHGDNFHDPQAAVDAFITLLEGMSKFFSVVFGPLLAFVLGYYFGTGQQGPNPPTGT